MPGFYVPIKAPDGCSVEPVDPSYEDGMSNTSETARKHRYKLEILEPFGTSRTGILTYLKKCSRPAIEFDRVVIHNSGNIIHRPGTYLWKPVIFSFYEVVSGDMQSKNRNKTAEMMYDWWASTMINVDTGLHNKPSFYMKNADLTMLDGNGTVIWRYLLYDCWPSNVDPCELSFSDNEIGDISVTLQYSKAIERNY